MIKKPCQNCGLMLEIEEFTHNVAILFEGEAVEECPQCGMALGYEEVDGTLELLIVRPNV